MENDLYEDQAPKLLPIFTVFLVLPLIAVALRLIARRVSHVSLWWDDWLLIVSSFILIVQYVFRYESIRNGEGKHSAIVPPEQIKTFLLYTYASEIYYPIVVTCVKSSILCLYLRLFGINKAFVKVVYAFLALVLSWGIAVLLSTIFQCQPVSAAWDKSIPHSHCLHLRRWLIAGNIPNITIDFAILVLPMPLLWRLNLSVQRKLGLCVIFLLGAITTIISILRLAASISIDVADVTWGYVHTAVYTTIEANIGIVCASLPVMAPLVRILSGRPATSNTNPAGQTNESNINSKQSKPSRPSQAFLRLIDDTDRLWPLSNHTVQVDGAEDGAREAHGLRLDRILVTRDIDIERTGSI